ncbi:MAG: GntR family transcriptional regulator [Pseudomonadota bacterium]
MSVAAFLDPAAWLSDSAGPRYVQLRRRLETGIASGVLAPNSALPPERELAQLTDLSRVTVRRAIQELVSQGLVEQRQGSGSFVRTASGRVEQSLSHLTSFTDDMRRRGMVTTQRWLERAIALPSPEEMLTLGLASGDRVARISRLRLAEGKPMAIERAALPLHVLPDPMMVTQSLYDALEARGERPSRAVQKISAVNLSPRDAGLLGVRDGAAGLNIHRISYHDEGHVTEFTRSLYRGDAYDFVAELRLSDDR